MYSPPFGPFVDVNTRFTACDASMGNPRESRTSHPRMAVSLPPTPYTDTSCVVEPRNVIVCARPLEVPPGFTTDLGAIGIVSAITVPECKVTTNVVSR